MRIWMLAGVLLVAPAANAQTPSKSAGPVYPNRAIRMIVPFPPGGPNDILGRVVAQKLTEQIGQQFVIDNRGGTGGVIVAVERS